MSWGWKILLNILVVCVWHFQHFFFLFLGRFRSEWEYNMMYKFTVEMKYTQLAPSFFTFIFTFKSIYIYIVGEIYTTYIRFKKEKKTLMLLKDVCWRWGKGNVKVKSLNRLLKDIKLAEYEISICSSLSSWIELHVDLLFSLFYYLLKNFPNFLCNPLYFNENI